VKNGGMRVGENLRVGWEGRRHEDRGLSTSEVGQRLEDGGGGRTGGWERGRVPLGVS
jgi:hypothetical protein